MPMTQEEFDRRREMIRQSIVTLAGALEHAFPPGYAFDAEKASDYNMASAYDEPMRSIASRIYDVMEAFDRMQEGIGLQNGEGPRFQKFLKGG